MTNETTLDKIQGAKTVKEMVLWSGLTQREIMKLEDKLDNAIEALDHPAVTSTASRDLKWELQPIRGQVTDAGIHVWRHGPADLNRDPNPVFNQWQPDVSEREA